MDDSQWYYEDHGRAQGPISTAELLQKIQKQELQHLSLVYRDGAGEWQPVETFEELSSQLGTVAPKSNADWIVLREIEVDGRERH